MNDASLTGAVRVTVAGEALVLLPFRALVGPSPSME